MKYILTVLILLLFTAAKAETNNAQCTGDPKKCTKEHSDEHKEGEDHDDHDSHGKEAEHKDDHGGDEHEESAQVGPNKGILEADEETGFKLSPEATKNFNLKFQSYSGGPLSLSMNSILQTTNEKNIYRMRDGRIKRIDISVISKSKSELTFTSSDLKSGDQIVVSGLGFLRMAELAAFGGAPEGHSH